MSNEALDTIKMGISFMLFAAVLFYVVTNVHFGKGLLSGSVAEIEEAADSVAYQNFAAFMGDGKVIPAAAAYAFIGYNENSIASITCYHVGESGTSESAVHLQMYRIGYGMDDACLKNHLRGYVRMQAAYNEAEGNYFLYLREADK